VDGFKSFAYDVLDDLCRDEMVVLDDAGSEHDPSKMAADKFCQIIGQREKRFTIVTTNISPSDWGTKWDVRVADRLLRNSVVVDLTGAESYQARS